MPMNICIDQGNSRTKVALFDEQGSIVKSFMYKQFTSEDVERLFSLYSLQDSIISSVVNIEPSLVNVLHRKSRQFILFDHQTPIPIQNDYETPNTLGQDRLAAAVGGAKLFPDENVLIIDIGSAITFDVVTKDNTYIGGNIDAGSAITYDVMTADGHYLGGNIAPGIKMRFKSLHQLTKKLPMMEVEENSLLPLFGKNTRDAMAAGVIRGVAFEVKGYVASLAKQGRKLQVYLTGGNAPFILNHVQSPMVYEKHLVLIGLNAILHYNNRA